MHICRSTKYETSVLGTQSRERSIIGRVQRSSASIDRSCATPLRKTQDTSSSSSATMFGFNVNKLKPNLKMAVHRIGIVKNKKANAAVTVRREIAALLADGKEEKARIRVRHAAIARALHLLVLLIDLTDASAR